MQACRQCMDEDAVSPVIGVILMVAITAVIAAVVFVVTTGLSSKNAQSAPTPVMQVDDINDRLTVVSATIGADWTRVQVTAPRCSGGIISLGGSGTSHHNQPATASSATAVSTGGCTGPNPKILVTANNAVIGAGDYLAFCASTGSQATNVDIQLMDTIANTVLGTYTFTSVRAC
ncbi:MAG TPA: type IV pilin N-terminal domain-containing protein [Candidatus Thermoplasmatota archaeon]|nr:type IV pilin N-terminal domain-containing protein [Candidatus Thermoplasmatota archaeon]